MEIKRVIHRSEKRISVAFPYNQEIIAIIKKIEGAKWSRTLKAWHFPDTKASVQSIKSAFPDFFNTKKPTPPPPQKTQPTAVADVVLSIKNKSILVQMPIKDADIKFVKSFTYTHWNNEAKAWMVTNYKDNLEKLKHYFGTRIKIINDNTEEQINKIQNRNKGILYQLT